MRGPLRRASISRFLTQMDVSVSQSEKLGAPDPTIRHPRDEQFRLIVESVKEYAIFMLDPGGYIATWNAGAHAIKGYTADEIIGRHFSCFFPPERQRQGWPQRILRIAETEGRYEEEAWRVRKDGSRFWADVVITPLRKPDGSLAGFAKVTRDRTDTRRLTELERASRRMNEFLATLAHELRNPLTPLRNAVAILQRESLEGNARWSTEILDRQLRHLTKLVDDLLDAGRITSGKIKLSLASLDLSKVIAEAIELFRPTLQSQSLELVLKQTAEALRVRGDVTRLSQVVVNLLDNAIKYGETKPIEIAVERQDGDAVIRVRDSGIGIPEGSLSRIFDLFSQGEQTFDRAKGGLGIGLSLVRRIVEMHGGTVDAVSDGPGLGSEFIVRLPLLREIPEG